MSEHSNSILSPREVECLTFLAKGHSNEGIANEIGIKPTTVAMHLANARQKLKATTRENAVAIAITQGLIKI